MLLIGCDIPGCEFEKGFVSISSQWLTLGYREKTLHLCPFHANVFRAWIDREQEGAISKSADAERTMKKGR